MNTPKLDKTDLYNSIIQNMSTTYKAKNADYGDSVGDTYNKFGDVSFLTRITDKYNRILSLSDKGECGEVKDEKLDDTILDLANYCVLWLVEREYKLSNISLEEFESKYPKMIPKQFMEEQYNCNDYETTPKSETLAGMTKTFLKSSYK